MAAAFGTGQVFWDMLWFFLFVIWIWILISVFTDIFRSRDLGGGAKTLWVLFVILLPYLGVFVYLIAHGGKMHERALRDATERQKSINQYVQQTASGATPTEEIAKLADLKAQGTISDDEFNQMKAKILAS